MKSLLKAIVNILEEAQLIILLFFHTQRVNQLRNKKVWQSEDFKKSSVLLIKLILINVAFKGNYNRSLEAAQSWTIHPHTPRLSKAKLPTRSPSLSNLIHGRGQKACFLQAGWPQRVGWGMDSHHFCQTQQWKNSPHLLGEK